MTRHPVRSAAIATCRLSPQTIGALIALGLLAAGTTGCAGPADVGGTPSGPVDPRDTTAPTVTAFVAASGTSPLSITAFTASDNSGVTGYAITEGPTPPAAGSTSWSATPPTRYATASVGSTSLYPWAIDAGRNVSPLFGPLSVRVDPAGPPDDIAPTVTAFVVANGTTSPLTITTLTATDNVGVTGYAITESPTPPAASSGSWTSTAPGQYATSSTGSVTLYPWARDAHGNVSPTFGSPVTVTLVAPARQLALGTNLNWFTDWDAGKLSADLALSARPWTLWDCTVDRVPVSGNGCPGNESCWAPLDRFGWPLVSAGTGFGAVFEAEPPPGTYRLTFTNRQGTASDSPTSYSGSFISVRKPSDGSAGCDYEAVAPDGATRRSTCDVVVRQWERSSFIWLHWSGSTGGITDVHLMRPLGSGTGLHAVGTLISDHAVDRLQWFSAIRVMQTQGGESGKTGGRDTTWSDRTSPWGPQTRSRGSPGHFGGIAIETAVAIANQTQKDLWLAVPFLADDAYIRKMAQTIKCGSDGFEPWVSAGTSTCAAGTPAFAPLASNLKLYLEHGNELWNPMAGYWEGENERAAGVAVCDWGDPYKLNAVIGTQTVNESPDARCPNQANPGWGWRRAGYLAVRNSLIFREVFGDAQMMTRIRPVLANQTSYATLLLPLRYIESVWGPTYTTGNSAYDRLGNADNSGTYANPRRPVSYYIYAIATAPYLPPENHRLPDVSTVAGIQASVYEQAARATAGYPFTAMGYHSGLAGSHGIKYVAYEGGDGLQAATIAPSWAPGTSYDPPLHRRVRDATGATDNVYRLVSSPSCRSGSTAPTGTGAGVSDGGCTWSYVSTYQQLVDRLLLASFHPVQGAPTGANIVGGLPAADQTSFLYGSLFQTWARQPNTELFVQYTLAQSTTAGAMFGLCAPTNRTDLFTVTGWSAAVGGISSDPRFEYGPKWEAIKAFSRAWSQR